MSDLLSVRDLAVARGGRRVLEGLDLTLCAGQAIILRGPNGIGKTTLLRTIAGLQPPVEGQVQMAADAVAYAGHADGLKGALTVAENLRFWAQVFAADGAGMAQALAAYRLHDLADRPAAMLSAGQKRRLGLARLVIAGRPLWVLDEPTVSLDSAAVGWFAEAVRAHLGSGGAALMATHIDLGLPEAAVLDLAPWRAVPGRAAPRPAGFDEAFA